MTFSGFGLSSFNILYEISDSEEVIKFSSLVNCLKGIGIFLGSIIAGSIVDSESIINLLSPYNFTSIQLSMVISVILRFLSYGILSKLAPGYPVKRHSDMDYFGNNKSREVV